MKKTLYRIILVILILTLSACSTTAAGISAASPTAQSTSSGTVLEQTGTTLSPTSTPISVEPEASHADTGDYEWGNTTATTIMLQGDTITTEGTGVTIEGSIATITAAGTYLLTGSLDDGQIFVDTNDEETVKLVLNGANIQSTTSAPIVVNDAEKTVIILADNTENTITDAASYVFESADVDEPNAAVFSKSDLSIAGNGLLTVNANYNDGIASKDGLVIAAGNLVIQAADDGVRGKDYLIIQNGVFNIQAQGDGLSSDDEEDPSRGYISIEGGNFNITANGDAIAAQTNVLITGGIFNLSTTADADQAFDDTISRKGIKGLTLVKIDAGTFTIDTYDDAIHSNNAIEINGGEFTLTTQDDGMHADGTLTINGGKIVISDSYEGLESAVITINDGEIRVNASDDGINIAGGIDGSGMNRGPGFMQPGGGRPQGGQMNRDSGTYTGSYFLYINGGYIVVNAFGDGLDVNGAIEMKGGAVIVSGSTEQFNAALDYDGYFTLSGGYLVAAGSSGMAQAPGETSSQNGVMVYFNNTLPDGTLVTIQDDSGKNVLVFAPEKEFQTIAFSSSDLQEGSKYNIFTGGSPTGSSQDGLYAEGVENPGSLFASFTISGNVTTVGTGGGRRF